jgi:Na+/H+ antiporter NhaD/arsenite permease-like protein
LQRETAFKVNSKGLTTFIKKEAVFSISLLLAGATSLFSIPRLEYINFKVIFSLFNLMLLVKAFEELKIMDMAAVSILGKFRDSRMVSLSLIALTFFSSMLLTNDVALLTFVPLTLIIGRKTRFNCMETVIFQTLAANIGSSLTPMGNPQNLFLFSYYNMDAASFFSTVAPFVLMGMVFLVLVNFKIPASNLIFSLEDIQIGDKRKAAVYGMLFAAVILSVFNIVDYRIASVLTAASVIIMDRNLFREIDYFLLLTFVCFFIFIGNISNMQSVYLYMKSFLSGSARTYFSSILLSQVISNVPSAILLSGFTGNWREVLLGVNIGGMGTLIASLASVISSRLYANEHNGGGKYLLKFSIYNFAALLLFALINYFLLGLLA